MVTREELQGQWNQVKGRLKEHWGQLTEDDLRSVRGSADRLVGVVQQKTGATRREVEEFLNNIMGEGGRLGERVSGAAHQYADAAQEYANEAGHYVRENYQRAAQQCGDYSARMARTVRSRPGESLAIAFGIGIIAGAIFFLGRRR